MQEEKVSVIGWSMKIAPQHRSFFADYTLKIKGGQEAVAFAKEEIHFFAHSFRLIEDSVPFIKFLGSVYLAIILIALTALFVIWGTWLKSTTSSHLYASQLTYGSPFFVALLCGFFVNILVATLRRWPFKLKQIPFLITHLGLLMVLGGVILKMLMGTQGSMILWKEAAANISFCQIRKPSTKKASRKESNLSLLKTPICWSTLPTQKSGLKPGLKTEWPFFMALPHFLFIHGIKLNPFPALPIGKRMEPFGFAHRFN